MENKLDVKKIALVGLMMAIVFVSNWVQIPVNFGGITRLHVANGFCILAGFLLGPLYGGLAAGAGSMLFDLTNPLYIASAPFTFVFKFVMALIAGGISWSGKSRGYSDNKNIIGSVFGAFAYVLLYLGKTAFTEFYVHGIPVQGVLAILLKKGFVSVVNAIFAIIVANVLIKFLNPMINKKAN